MPCKPYVGAHPSLASRDGAHEGTDRKHGESTLDTLDCGGDVCSSWCGCRCKNECGLSRGIIGTK